jgi:hypothetical protein
MADSPKLGRPRVPFPDFGQKLSGNETLMRKSY